jgi:hypothetical protein
MAAKFFRFKSVFPHHLVHLHFSSKENFIYKNHRNVLNILCANATVDSFVYFSSGPSGVRGVHKMAAKFFRFKSVFPHHLVHLHFSSKENFIYKNHRNFLNILCANATVDSSVYFSSGPSGVRGVVCVLL